MSGKGEIWIILAYPEQPTRKRQERQGSMSSSMYQLTKRSTPAHFFLIVHTPHLIFLAQTIGKQRGSHPLPKGGGHPMGGGFNDSPRITIK